MNDPVFSPAHYAGNGIEAKDAMRSMMDCADVSPSQAYWWGCAFKYLWRWHAKNGVQDLQKASQCIRYLIEDLRENGLNNGEA